MPVPGPSALREAPSGEGGGGRGGAPAEPSSWGQRAAGGGRNFFQNLPLAGLRSEPGKGPGGLWATEREGVGICWLAIPSVAHGSGGASD